MKKLTGIAVLVFAMAVLSVPAAAHIKCWSVSVLLPYLQEKLGEAPIIMGIGDGEYPVQIWRSEDGGTWSVVTYRLPDQACLVLMGVDMREIEWVEPIGGPS